MRILLPLTFLSLICLCSACHKSDTPTKTTITTTTTAPVQKEYLSQVIEPVVFDTVNFLYTNDTVLRCIEELNPYLVYGPLKATFFTYSNGQLQSLYLGNDTMESSVPAADTLIYSFTYNANGRIANCNLHNNTTGVIQYYDSLTYDVNGNLSVIYSFSYIKTPPLAWSFITELTWDANGDVSQILTGDSLSTLSTDYFIKDTFAYDNQNNPYLANNYGLILALQDAPDSAVAAWYYLSKHNPVSYYSIQSRAQVGSPWPYVPNSTLTYVYTYDSYGNPLTYVGTYTQPGSPSSSGGGYFSYVLK